MICEILIAYVSSYVDNSYNVQLVHNLWTVRKRSLCDNYGNLKERLKII